LEKRWRMLKSVSRFFLEKYKNRPKNFVLSGQSDCSLLLKKIYSEVPYFDDWAFYKNKKIYFLKRAQLLISDIWGAFEGKGLGYFKNLDYLTAFADYKLPQILQSLGILEYSPKLLLKIKNGQLIKSGSLLEIEIRAATVAAVEFLKEELRKRGKKVFSFQLDWLLWEKSQKEKMALPYHLTKTIFY
ncbi:MAG: queuosine salvage family protein, partial [Minisyncoccales bacterium]